MQLAVTRQFLVCFRGGEGIKGGYRKEDFTLEELDIFRPWLERGTLRKTYGAGDTWTSEEREEVEERADKGAKQREK